MELLFQHSKKSEILVELTLNGKTKALHYLTRITLLFVPASLHYRCASEHSPLPSYKAILARKARVLTLSLNLLLKPKNYVKSYTLAEML